MGEIVNPSKEVNARGLCPADTWHPIRVYCDGSIITSHRFYYAIYQGIAFGASHRFENISSDSSIYVYIENPSDSGKKINISLLEITTTDQAHADIYINNTKTASGTSIPKINYNTESTNISVLTLEYDGTYTPGDKIYSSVIPGGSAKYAVGGAVSIGEAFIIKEDFNMIIQVINKSTNAADISIHGIWWEET